MHKEVQVEEKENETIGEAKTQAFEACAVVLPRKPRGSCACAAAARTIAILRERRMGQHILSAAYSRILELVMPLHLLQQPLHDACASSHFRFPYICVYINTTHMSCCDHDKSFRAPVRVARRHYDGAWLSGAGAGDC